MTTKTDERPGPPNAPPTPPNENGRGLTDVPRHVGRRLARTIGQMQEAREEQQRRERRHRDLYAALRTAYERERHAAEALRALLVPGLTRHTFPGLSVAAFCEPATDNPAGGDFTDAFLLPGPPAGRVAVAVAVAVGDVSGKGISTALRSLQLREALRAFARAYPDTPAAVFERLNEHLVAGAALDETSPEYFACLCLAVITPQTGEAIVLTAGCEPPFVLRARDGLAEALRLSGVPLGVLPGQAYEAYPVRLEPGDALVMLTDGITERRRGGEFLGYAAVIASAEESFRAAPTAVGLGRAMLDAADAFGGGPAGRRDDTSLLVTLRNQQTFQEETGA